MPAPNKVPGILRNLRIKRVDLVDMGANFDPSTGDGAHIMLFKRYQPEKDSPSLGSVHVDSPDWDEQDADPYEKDLSAESRRRLPDSAFAAVWTDAKGEKHRKLPIHDAGHLAAARGRLNAAQMPADVKAAARRKIDAASHKEKSVAKSILKFAKSLGTALKVAAETDPVKKAALLKEAEAEAEAAMKEAEAEAAAPPPGSDQHESQEAAHISALQALHDHLGKAIGAYGAGPHPDGHPVHEMKAMHTKVAGMLKDAGCDEPGALGKNAEAEAAHVTKRFTELEKRNTELEKQLKEEINKRADAEMRTILKEFKATAFDLDKDAPLYRAMKQNSPDLYERTMNLFKAADAQLAESALFKKSLGSGRSGGGDGDAWAEIETLADKLVEKATDGMTREKAIEKIMLDPKHKDLVKRYRSATQ